MKIYFEGEETSNQLGVKFSAVIPKFVDKWFIDDGQLYLKPWSVDGVLKLLDNNFQEAGASRGRKSVGDDIKSTARLLCPVEREIELHGWGHGGGKPKTSLLRFGFSVQGLGCIGKAETV